MRTVNMLWLIPAFLATATLAWEFGARDLRLRMAGYQQVLSVVAIAVALFVATIPIWRYVRPLLPGFHPTYPVLTLIALVAPILVAVWVAERHDRLPWVLVALALLAAWGAQALWGASCGMSPGLGMRIGEVPPDPCEGFYAMPIKLAAFAAIMVFLAGVRAWSASSPLAR